MSDRIPFRVATTVAVLIVLAGHAGPSRARAAAGPQDAVAAAVGDALQADATRALARLRPLLDLPPADRAFRACMIDRFDAPAPREPVGEPSSFSQEVFTRFRTYWRRSLLDPTGRDQGELDLRDDLAESLGVAADWDAVEGEVQRRLAQEGRFALLGRTGPLRELMVWRRQRETMEPVQLPDGPFEVKVVYLEAFESLGWADWATCGRRGAGGWATREGLFAVTPRYQSLDGEEFRVTFRGHEAQHFADASRFPGLASWEREYRAKLVELAQIDVTQEKVLRKFLEDQSDDPGQPHSYANRKVLGEVATALSLSRVEALLTADSGLLNAAAVRLLQEDTVSRSRDAPGSEDRIVERGRISTAAAEVRMAVRPDGLQIVWGTIGRESAPDQQDLWETHREGGAWSRPAPAAFNTEAVEFDPAFSADGQRLYFHSDRPGGHGGTDIYAVTVKRDGFGAPTNVGPGVNSAGDEWAPTPLANGALIFASDGWGGHGRHDLLEASLRTPGEPPRNLGDTVNGPGDDFDAAVTFDQELLIFSSGTLSDEDPRVALFTSRRNGDGWAQRRPTGDGCSDFVIGASVDPRDPERFYYAANCSGGEGRMDIHEGRLPQRSR